MKGLAFAYYDASTFCVTLYRDKEVTHVSASNAFTEAALNAPGRFESIIL